MGRILFFLLIGIVLWLLLRNALKARKPEAPPAETKQGEDFVACARCGVNLPRSEALKEAGQFRCADPKTCKPAG